MEAFFFCASVLVAKCTFATKAQLSGMDVFAYVLYLSYHKDAFSKPRNHICVLTRTVKKRKKERERERKLWVSSCRLEIFIQSVSSDREWENRRH